MEAEASQLLSDLVASTFSTILAILLAVAPSNVVIRKKTKIILTLTPGITNLIVFIVATCFSYYDGGWDAKSFLQFATANNLTLVIKQLLGISGGACLVLGLIIGKVKSNTFNDKRLMQHYVKMTDMQKSGCEIIIIGGSMDFLGRRPCKDVIDEMQNKCPHKVRYKTKFGRFFALKHGQEKCKYCCVNNPQWVQLVGLIDKECPINIICTNPTRNNETDKFTKELLGLLLKLSKRANDNVNIFFFERKDDPNVRGRIVEDRNNIKHICLNFKRENDQHSYERPIKCEDTSSLGKFYIEAFENIKSKATPLTGPISVNVSEPSNIDKERAIKQFVDLYEARS